MTKTPKTFAEWLKTECGSVSCEAEGVAEDAWTAGHAAGRLEGLEEAAKLAKARMPKIGEENRTMHEAAFGRACELIDNDIRALAKDQERA